MSGRLASAEGFGCAPYSGLSRFPVLFLNHPHAPPSFAAEARVARTVVTVESFARWRPADVEPIGSPSRNELDEAL